MLKDDSFEPFYEKVYFFFIYQGYVNHPLKIFSRFPYRSVQVAYTVRRWSLSRSGHSVILVVNGIETL